MTFKGYIKLFFVYAVVDLNKISALIVVSLFDNMRIIIYNAVNEIFYDLAVCLIEICFINKLLVNVLPIICICKLTLLSGRHNLTEHQLK